VANQAAQAQNIVPPVAPVEAVKTPVQQAAENYRQLPVDANPLERASAMNDYRQALHDQRTGNVPTMAEWQAQMAGPEHIAKLDQLREGGGKIDTENAARNMREDANKQLGELNRALSDDHKNPAADAAIEAQKRIIALKRDTGVGSYEKSLDHALQKLMAQQDKGAIEKRAERAKELAEKEKNQPVVPKEKPKVEEGEGESEDEKTIRRLTSKPRAERKYASRNY
jgi:hypothetical protein